VQPIVGVYSDACTSRFGRRRPFILVGALLCIIGMFFVGNSANFGIMLGDDDSGSEPIDHKFGLAIAITFLWVINLSVNAMQGPTRALLADLVPQESLQFGNAILTATNGLSNIIAYLIGAQVLQNAKEPYQVLFMVGCGFLAVCTIPTLIAAKEERFVPKEVISSSPIVAFAKIGKSFITMPNVVVRIFIVFFFCWCAYSPFMINITLFYGENLEKTKAEYNHGVQLGFYALAINAAVSFLYSMTQTPLLGLIGIRPTFFLAQVIGTVCFGAFWFLSYKNIITMPIAMVLTALVAINFTAFNSIPYALLADAVESSKIGLYMGVLNSASTLAQVFTNSVGGKLVEVKGQNVAWAFCFGAALSVAACISIWTLKLPGDISKNKPKALSERAPLIQA